MYPGYRNLLSESEREKRFKRFQKTRAGRMLSLQHDISAALASYSGVSIDKLSYLAHALWIATSATKLEADAKIIIEKFVPRFFDTVPPAEQTDANAGFDRKEKSINE